MTMKSIAFTDRNNALHHRDSLISAGVLMLNTLLLMLLGFAAKAGAATRGEMLINLAFPASLVLSMPFWLMKKVSRGRERKSRSSAAAWRYSWPSV